MKETQAQLQLLTVFAAVVEHQSFTLAAQQLGVGKGTVSRSIARLEAQLGVELLHRTTHHVALSSAGAALHERIAHHLAALQSALADMPEQSDEPSGLLRITAPPDLGVTLLPPLLASFARRYPQVRFDIRLTGEHVDLIKEGYDLAIRVSTRSLKDSTLRVRRVGQSTLSFYAAPSYLARQGRPRSLGEEGHSWVLHSTVLRGANLRPEVAQFVVDDFFLVRDLLQASVGVGLLPDFVARSGLREGLLEKLPLQHHPPPVGQLLLLYPSSGQTPRKVTAFCDFLAQALPSEL